MHPFVHGDVAVAAVFRRPHRYPSCGYGFYAAHRTTLDAWHAWVADQAGATARLDQMKAARPTGRTGHASGLVGRLQWVIGTALIAAGRCAQGTTTEDAGPDAA
jgi:hypothetical protein